MRTEWEKMLAGDLYNPLDPDLVRKRERARDLCQALNATREAEQERRRAILTDLLLVYSVLLRGIVIDTEKELEELVYPLLDRALGWSRERAGV